MKLPRISPATFEGNTLSMSTASGITLTAACTPSAGTLGWLPDDHGTEPEAGLELAEPLASKSSASWSTEFRKWLRLRHGEPRQCIPVLAFQALEQARRQFARIRCRTAGSAEENLALSHVSAYN